MKDPEGFPEDLAWEEYDGWTKGMVDEALVNVRAAAPEYLRDGEDPWLFTLAHAVRDRIFEYYRGMHEKKEGDQ